MALTGNERLREELGHPRGVDDGVWRLDGHVVKLVLDALTPDPVDVVHDPLGLEHAGDRPDVVLFWVSATLGEGPGGGNVLHEMGVLDRLVPDPDVGELWPSGVVDLDELVLVHEVLLPRHYVLEEAEGTVLLGGQLVSLQGEISVEERRGLTKLVAM